MKYKPSVFNYYFDLDNDGIGIFNTLSNSIAELTPENYRNMKNFDENKFEADVKNALVSNGFLVPYILNEYDAINKKRVDSILNDKFSFYRILTTLDCNARCFYCYEGASSHEYMDLKTAEQTADFIIDHVENRRCTIQWFGGEPLMNTKVIDLISEKLRNKLTDDKIRFVMITNASLASPRIIEKMKNEWNLYLLQITLDGDSSEYERRKNYVSLEKPFELVINNIKNILQAGLKVSLRLNYDKNNYRSVCNLIKYLREQNFNGMSNFTIYSYPIFSSSQGFQSENTGWEEWFEIQKVLVENEFLSPLEAFSLRERRTQCYACSTKSLVVLPNGKLIKCTMAMKDSYAQVGDILNGIVNHDVMDKWCDTSLTKACSRCCFLPMCQGGCRAGILNYTSDLCIHQKNFVGNVLRERIKHLRAASKQN